MGSGNGWRCKKCGAGEEYWTGYGMASCNVSETRESIERGELGDIAKYMLSEDFPVKVNTIDERAFFKCPSCGKLVGGMNVRLYHDGSKPGLVLHVPPNECPGCGEEFGFVDDCTPVSEGDIAVYVDGILKSGCPECGSKDVEPTMILWD